VGQYVTFFEKLIRQFTGAKYSVAVSSGTAALHTALLLEDVKPNTEVITQPLTFVATINAIAYCGAQPVFVDAEKSTLGLDPAKLNDFLLNHAVLKADGLCYNKSTGRIITACVPMHTFGHPARIDQIIEVCSKYNIPVIEDSAESLGSFYKDKHTGTYGTMGILSFNGNKPVTTGGGGMIITNDERLATKAKHMTTTAKEPHPWEFMHDIVGYNYRMPNINAAVGCAQMERITETLENKRNTAMIYKNFFQEIGVSFINEPENARSNYWLNTIILKDRQERDSFLAYANEHGVQSRPVWTLMTKLPMYQTCQCEHIEVAQWLEDRLVNIPSSVRI